MGVVDQMKEGGAEERGNMSSALRASVTARSYCGSDAGHTSRFAI